MDRENIVELKDISVSFDGEQILNKLNLNIKDKEFITLLGPSGCGKTTTLRLIAGFLEPDEGEVIFEGKVINDVPAYKRQVNTIFQRYALFPHLNVYENVAFGLRIKKLPENEIKQKVEEMLKLVNLSGLENLASKLYSECGDRGRVSAYCFDFIGDTLAKLTENLREQYKNIPIIYAGGVMSNGRIKERLSTFDNVYFSAPEFSSDNAAGVALLGRRKYISEQN